MNYFSCFYPKKKLDEEEHHTWHIAFLYDIKPSSQGRGILFHNVMDFCMFIKYALPKLLETCPEIKRVRYDFDGETISGNEINEYVSQYV